MFVFVHVMEAMRHAEREKHTDPPTPTFIHCGDIMTFIVYRLYPQPLGVLYFYMKKSFSMLNNQFD